MNTTHDSTPTEGVTREQVRAVLETLYYAKGRTDFLQGVLAADHVDLLGVAVDTTPANSLPRSVLIDADRELRKRMTRPSDELVDVVTQLANQVFE